MHLEIVLTRFLGALPFSVSRLLARFLATLLWYSNSDVRKNTTVNINLCFPDLTQTERKKLIKQSVLESARTGLEMPMAWLKSAEVNLGCIHKVIGHELVEQAIENNQGVIIIAPHLGNWEYLAHYLGQTFQITNLYKPPKNPGLFKIMEKGRNSTGGKLAPTNKKGVVMLLKTLKSAGVVGILPDQVPEDDNGCEFADFFSHKVATMTLITKLLHRTDSVAVACFAKRLPQGGFNILFQEVDQRVYSKDIQVSVSGLNKTVEQLVALAPAQYQWEYKRFKKGPNGKRHIYV